MCFTAGDGGKGHLDCSQKIAINKVHSKPASYRHHIEGLSRWSGKGGTMLVSRARNVPPNGPQKLHPEPPSMDMHSEWICSSQKLMRIFLEVPTVFALLPLFCSGRWTSLKRQKRHNKEGSISLARTFPPFAPPSLSVCALLQGYQPLATDPSPGTFGVPSFIHSAEEPRNRTKQKGLSSGSRWENHVLIPSDFLYRWEEAKAHRGKPAKRPWVRPSLQYQFGS